MPDRRDSTDEGSGMRSLLAGTGRLSAVQSWGCLHAKLEECGRGLSGQKGPRHKEIWLQVPVFHSGCQRIGDLEGFGAGKECEHSKKAAAFFKTPNC